MQVPYFEVYLTGDPKAKYESMKKVVRILESVDPRAWEAFDYSSVSAMYYARMSIAASGYGKEGEAEYYLKRAIENWKKRKVWNYEEQAVMLKTPGPSEEEAKKELFRTIKALDEDARVGKNERSAHHVFQSTEASSAD